MEHAPMGLFYGNIIKENFNSRNTILFTIFPKILLFFVVEKSVWHKPTSQRVLLFFFSTLSEKSVPPEPTSQLLLFFQLPVRNRFGGKRVLITYIIYFHLWEIGFAITDFPSSTFFFFFFTLSKPICFFSFFF